MTLPERTYSAEELRQVAFEAAGVGSAAIMRRAPHVVMPSEEIVAAIEALLADCRDRVGHFDVA